MAIALLAAVMAPSLGQAKSHQWDMLRVFSNAEGNVQFINMFVSDPSGTGEWFFAGKFLTSNSNTFEFPNDLPMDKSTFLTWVLIATQDYAELPGAPTPDYIIPPNFFDPAGDELRYRSIIDIFTIAAGTMPTDGFLMLQKNAPPTPMTTLANQGINFDGAKGTVNQPPSVPSLQEWSIALAALLLLTLGGLAVRRRSGDVRAG